MIFFPSYYGILDMTEVNAYYFLPNEEISMPHISFKEEVYCYKKFKKTIE